MAHDLREARRVLREFYGGVRGRVDLDSEAAHETLDDDDLSGVRRLAAQAIRIANEAREIALEARNRAKNAEFLIDEMVQNGREEL